MKARTSLLARACLQALHMGPWNAASVAIALLGSSVALAGDRVGREADFDIPSQSLESALLEFSRQADVQVMVESTALAGLTSARLKGRLVIGRALDALLQNTGLSYDAIGSTVTVRPIVASTTVPVLRLAAVPAGAATEVQWLAWNETPAASSEPARAPAGNIEVLDEVIVTGSHIRGETSAGSQVLVLDRDDLDASGYGTIQDVLNTVPQNVAGGPGEDFTPNASGNYSRGVGVNLRGLGGDATLVLVNGRRQPLSGIEGYFVDISSIPTSAVERIEILTDGASAIYGSDAVGGVVNIILRREYDGAETRGRFGSAEGADEWSVSQVLGNTWTSGNALIGYQYNEREVLARADRAYTATADKRRFGGDDFSWPLSNPGNILDPATFLPVFAIPRGQDGSSLTAADLLPGTVNMSDPIEAADLMPEQKLQSAYVTANQQLSDRISLSADARYSERRMTMRAGGAPAILVVPPTNPFYVDAFGDGSPLLIFYSMLDDLGSTRIEAKTETFAASLGASFDLLAGWRVRATGSYGEEKMDWSGDALYDFAALDTALADTDPATAFNPFADGSSTNPATLDGMRYEQHERSHSTGSGFNLMADGPLFDLPGGAAKLAVGVDYRQERLEAGAVNPFEVDHDVTAAFAELALPVLGAASAGAEPVLELSLAARHEEYSDFGATTDPKIGVSWVPHPIVRLRGTWGTSFKAPRLTDVNENPTTTRVSLTTFPDPQSPTGQSIVLVRTGKNADLHEETADIWTAGLDLRFADIATHFSFTYFDINYQDRISEGGPASDPRGILLEEERWAPIIQRNPTQAQIDALCSSPGFGGDPGSCAATPPAVIVDMRLHNLGSLQVEGFDAALNKAFDTALGAVDLGVSGTYLLRYERFASEQSPGFDLVDTVNNPPALRLRGSASWRRGGWRAGAFVNYTNDYADDVSVPDRRIDSWTTIDVRLAYQTGDRSWLSDTEFALSATNVFDEAPPFVNTLNGYDVVNADLTGRVITAQFSKAW